RRRRDLVLQLAVASQAYSAIRLIEHDNLQVIWAIRSAVTTTTTAIRTALLSIDRGADLALRPRAEIAGADDAWADVLRALDTVDERKRATLDVLDQRAA